MNRVASRAGITVLIALLLVGGLCFFLTEYVTRADNWVVYEGSPHVYDGGNIGTGAIVDREGVLLLDMNEGRTYSSDSLLRKATLHWLGDRNGSVSAPAVTEYSGKMVGYDLISGVYTHADQTGVAELTLSAQLQSAALEAMGDYAGTAAVYNYKTGQILCAVSTPTFDPDDAPTAEEAENYDGIYLNRFTQGSYIPGSIYKIVTLAAALETTPDILEQTFECTGNYQIGDEDDLITCEVVHGTQDLQNAFRNSCNCAFAQVSQQLGKETLKKYVDKCGVAGSVSFDGITTAGGSFRVDDASELSVAWSSIGQYEDLINPCAFMTFMGAIAGDGRGAIPYLVERVNLADSVTYQASNRRTSRVVSEETAETIRQFMEYNVQSLYGAQNFPGLTVCAKTGTAQVGGDRKPNAMFTGFTADEDCPLAFIVCVENAGYGSSVCVPIASKILTACAQILKN